MKKSVAIVYITIIIACNRQQILLTCIRQSHPMPSIGMPVYCLQNALGLGHF